MLRTLRSRLILSHLLPLLVIVPLMGIALIAVLETQVLLPSLSEDLAGQARLVADLAANDAGLWTNRAEAQAFLDRVDDRLSAQVMLIDPAGVLIASNDPADADRVGQKLALPLLARVRPGQVASGFPHSAQLDTQIADTVAAVAGPDGQTAGFVRLTRRVTYVNQRLLRLRYLIAGVLAAGLLLGGGAGWVLATTLERPLARVTQAVYRLAGGRPLAPLPEQGPQEIQMLLHAVNTLVQRLNTLERNRSQLLANLVHELGRPLGAIGSAIQALAGGAADDLTLRQELLSGMKAEMQGLRRLVDDLARLYDREIGLLELALRPVVLDEWLPVVLSTWREAAHQKGVAWEAAIPSHLPVLTIDPDRMAQALGNLLSNAVKYTPAGGKITAAAGVQEQAVWISISDTGPGMLPEERARIFAPFFRGAGTGRFPQGMGLGLTIARDLTEAHGGRIEVESATGAGSRFVLWLPLVPDGQPTSEAPA